MPRRQLVIEIPALGAIDRNRGGIGRQLAEALRNAISRGELAAGERLPSTRALAESLGLSRGTVTEAYEQLMAEGCLDAQPGASTKVPAVRAVFSTELLVLTPTRTMLDSPRA
ncbi:GntR family transcriptional regulator [Pseudoduganella danionis]|uniref:GntR family transcriptional regulator n=1 Tax=Pseudoduganella danionis TaxID=1890295 RepID=UPI001E42B603|nr:winged helix-turn-helix domain-containing protein [Pseudoduganella danionis]